MRRKQIVYSLLTTILITLIILQMGSTISAQIHINKDSKWDISGRITPESDNTNILVYDPKEEGLNETENGYERPSLYLYVISVDVDGDDNLDYYIGFKGIALIDLPELNYTPFLNMFSLGITNIWRLKIPDESPLAWRILYYPDPLYADLSPKLSKRMPIIYVDLASYTGCNLIFQIDKGLNATVGNFTTFGAGNPLVPSMPDFPGYNVSVPLYGGTIVINTEETSFFTDAMSFIGLVVACVAVLKLCKRKIKPT